MQITANCCTLVYKTKMQSKIYNVEINLNFHSLSSFYTIKQLKISLRMTMWKTFPLLLWRTVQPIGFFGTHTPIRINYLLILFMYPLFFLPYWWIEYKYNMVPSCLLLCMQKEITAIISIRKAPPRDATSGTTTLFPLLLLHEPCVQRSGFPPKLHL